MVQQLSLVSSIPKSQYHILTLSLESLTGMKPQQLKQHTVILKPKYPFTPELAAGKVNQIESYRIRMTRVWDIPAVAAENTTILKGESYLDTSKHSTKNKSIWTLQLSDIPAAGKRTVSIQNIYETTIYKTDDILGYVDELGHMPEIEFWNKGVRFYYNDVVIEVFRIYIRSKGYADELTRINDSKEKDYLRLTLLDGSETYQIKCFVNVSKLNDLDNVARAGKQLENLKNELAGLIELEVPDRIYLDSRVNSRIVAGNAPQRR